MLNCIHTRTDTIAPNVMWCADCGALKLANTWNVPARWAVAKVNYEAQERAYNQLEADRNELRKQLSLAYF